MLVTLSYNSSLITFSRVLGSNNGLDTGTGIDPGAPPSMFMETFSASPNAVVDEISIPATVVVSDTAGAGATQAGRVNVFNIEFRIAPGLSNGTFIPITSQVTTLTNDVAVDITSTLPVVVISNTGAAAASIEVGTFN